MILADLVVNMIWVGNNACGKRKIPSGRIEILLKAKVNLVYGFWFLGVRVLIKQHCLIKYGYKIKVNF